jgi:hypothetical protein
MHNLLLAGAISPDRGVVNPFLFDENPGVAFAGLDGAAAGGKLFERLEPAPLSTLH